MEGTREVIKDRAGIACIVAVLVLCFFSIPWFGTSLDGCNFLSYSAWFAGDGSAVDGCEGPVLCNGLPCWAWPSLIFFPINKVLISLAWTRWRTIDEVVPAFPWGHAGDARKEAWGGGMGRKEASETPV